MRAAVILLCLLSTGCAFRGPLQRVAVDHNAMVAHTANELMLVNILRAREREPLHFTAVNKLFGDASISGTADSSIAIKGGTETETLSPARVVTGISNLAGTELTTPKLSVTMGGKTSVDVGVFDTQEFYQGITASLPAGTIAHYLHQGWSDELFTYLFVSQIDFVVSDRIKKMPLLATLLGERGKAGLVIDSIVNDPDDPDAAVDFRAFVNCYRLTHFPRTAKDQPLVRLSRITDLSVEGLALLDGDKFDIEDVDGKTPQSERWINRKGKGGDGLALRQVEANSPEAERCGTAARGAPTEAELAGGGQLDGLVSAVKSRRFSAGPRSSDERAAALDYRLDPNVLFLDPGADNEHQGTVASGIYRIEVNARDRDGREHRQVVEVPVDVQVVLRSVDGVIYFLGEYLRSKIAEPYLLFTREAGYVPILRVTVDRPRHSFASTRFRDSRYYVPAGINGSLVEGGRSSQVFALVEQLINLQKTAKERPTTQTVRVLQ